MSSVTITASDGFPIGATLFEPAKMDENGTNKAPIVLISSATAVLQQIYWSFAKHLAEQVGCIALTYDFRGIGESRPWIPRKQSELQFSVPQASQSNDKNARSMKDLRNVGIDTWGLLDQNACAAYLCTSFPDRPLILVGNSVGAHIMPLLNEQWRKRLVRCLVVSGNIHLLEHGHGSYLSRLFNTRVILGGLPRIYGYLPAKQLGIFEDLPYTASLQWSVWITLPRHMCDASKEYEQAFATFDSPILSLSFEDDHIATRGAFECFAALLGGTAYGLERARSRVHWMHIDPKSMNWSKVGHMLLFSSKNKETIWKPLESWFLNGTLPVFVKAKL